MFSAGQLRAKNASDLDINIKDPQDCPTDTVSSISWTPSGNNPTFATSDWASYIRIYNLDPDSLALAQQACFDAESPCLSVKWHEDETTVFAGCTDGSVKSYDIATGNCSVIGNHEGPVKSVHWIPASNTLLTLSFDKTLRFWDPRQIEPVAMHRLDYKVYCSDMLYPYLILGLSEAKCLVVDLTKPQEELGRNIKYWDSPFGAKVQITSIRLFQGDNNRIGWGMSANDTRSNLAHFAQGQQVFDRSDNIMTFKGHKVDEKQKSTLYPVNCLGFHPHRGYQFLCTGGGEGKMYFWDAKQKNKVAEFDFRGNSITQVEIDPTGKYMAYALGYDWARGIQGYMSQPSKVCCHVLQDRELEYRTQNGAIYPIKYP